MFRIKGRLLVSCQAKIPSKSVVNEIKIKRITGVVMDRGVVEAAVAAASDFVGDAAVPAAIKIQSVLSTLISILD